MQLVFPQLLPVVDAHKLPVLQLLVAPAVVTLVLYVLIPSPLFVLLLVPLLFQDQVHLLLPLPELVQDLLVGTDGSLGPRMLGHLHDRRSFPRHIREHLLHQVLEAVRKEGWQSLAAVGVPKDVVSLFFDELVVRVGDCWLLEGWIASIHDEQNNSSSEDVRLPAVITLRCDFRSHVALGSQLGLEDARAVLATDQTREPEVRDFENKRRGK